MPEIKYVSGESGEIASEKETAYLLTSANMKRRLLEAKDRQTGIPFEEAREKLGI